MKILADCDGVLLDWEKAFHTWMSTRGHHQSGFDTYNINIMYEHIALDEAKRMVKEFNNSSWMLGLEPLRDAVEGVNTLLHYGHHLDVITSLSLDPYAKQARQINLEAVFGQGVISELTCLDTGGEKHEALAKYEGTGYWWIEDKPENADIGTSVGLDSVLVEHGHNMFYKGDAKVVKDWAEIYDYAVSKI